ncbi:hypothetical protein ANN_10776 [Periplaneta americana]|uniref:Uncharacterized protein n=1 Tax=Periplaneta americana TaxID=6978 RepID=A0ABQ8T4P7_PERAM|nr:hypothetical protein ANN_10776 [Periplaneta americana]
MECTVLISWKWNRAKDLNDDDDDDDDDDDGDIMQWFPTQSTVSSSSLARSPAESCNRAASGLRDFDNASHKTAFYFVPFMFALCLSVIRFIAEKNFSQTYVQSRQRIVGECKQSQDHLLLGVEGRNMLRPLYFILFYNSLVLFRAPRDGLLLMGWVWDEGENNRRNVWRNVKMPSIDVERQEIELQCSEKYSLHLQSDLMLNWGRCDYINSCNKDSRAGIAWLRFGAWKCVELEHVRRKYLPSSMLSQSMSWLACLDLMGNREWEQTTGLFLLKERKIRTSAVEVCDTN